MSHLDETGDHDVRRDEAMISNRRVMADMVPAPENGVVADRDEGLDDIVLEDEAVLAERDIAPDERVRAHVRSRLITLLPGRLVEPAAQGVSLGIDESGIEMMLPGGEALRQILERHHRHPEKLLAPQVLPLDAEGHDIVLGVVREVLVGDLREGAVTDEDELFRLDHGFSHDFLTRRSSRRFAIGNPASCGTRKAS